MLILRVVSETSSSVRIYIGRWHSIDFHLTLHKIQPTTAREEPTQAEKAKHWRRRDLAERQKDKQQFKSLVKAVKHIFQIEYQSLLAQQQRVKRPCRPEECGGTQKVCANDENSVLHVCFVSSPLPLVNTHIVYWKNICVDEINIFWSSLSSLNEILKNISSTHSSIDVALPLWPPLLLTPNIPDPNSWVHTSGRRGERQN